jgi:DNA polymerase delta subunit 1
MDTAYFSLKECAPIVGADGISFDNEKSMLCTWMQFVTDIVDPDIITGHNIEGFDIEEMQKKANTIGCAYEFSRASRQVGYACDFSKTEFSSKQQGRRKAKEYLCPGRVFMDTLRIFQREHKLRSYTLNAISKEFLGDQKESIHHSDITPLFNGGPEDRVKYTTYGNKDAWLPVKLLAEQMFVINYLEMAKVTGVTLKKLIFAGQSVKVMTMILSKCRKLNVLVPFYQYQEEEDIEEGYCEDDEREDGDEAAAKKKKKKQALYTGATVLEPLRGFYEDPLFCLDFQSLYPSIMIAMNYCYCTMVKNKNILARLNPEDYELSPSAEKPAYFIKRHKKIGILPMILKELLDDRKRAKDLKAEWANKMNGYKKELAELKPLANTIEGMSKCMELEKQIAAAKAKVNIYEGSQLAKKISANSVYGFTGASVGKLPCLEIGSAVTAVGRKMIEIAKNFVESYYTKANGFNFDAKVVYGDTDSIMVHAPGITIKEAIEIGKKAEIEATEAVRKEVKDTTNIIKFAFEKVYCPYLLIQKKRYAGLLWTRADKSDKLDFKGIEPARRDNCTFTTKTILNSLNTLMLKKDREGAKNIIRKATARLKAGEIDVSELVITKGYSKPEEEYKNKQIHIELVKKMKKRDAGSAPVLGDRVPYVMICKGKGSKAFEQAEDPMYAIEHKIPIDYDYYLNKQLLKPVGRLFGPIMENPATLVHGSHIKVIKQSTGGNYGIRHYAIEYDKCASCGIVLQEKNEGHSVKVCSYCLEEDKLASTYTNLTNMANEMEKWDCGFMSQCQSCQKNHHTELNVCVNGACPIFYARKKIKRDLNDVYVVLNSFNAMNDW